MNLAKTYQDRATKHAQKASELKARYNRLSFIRLVLFGIAVFVSIFLWSLSGTYLLIFLLLFLPAFFVFVRWHQGIQKEQYFEETLAKINGEELTVLGGQYDFFDAGKNFIDTSHPYTIDLDIFGDYSFFQYTNRCSTTIGRERLAQYLSQTTLADQIRQRQAAVDILRGQLDWRQDFQALGRNTADDIRHLQRLKTWLQEESFVLNNSRLKAAMLINPFVMLAAILLVLYVIPWQAGLLFLLFPGLIIRQTIERVNKTHEQTSHAEKILATYARLIQHIEDADFPAGLLSDLQNRLKEEGSQASKGIRQLSYIISQLNVRYNAFAVILNILGLWDLYWIYRLEKWKASYKTALPQWFESLAELEALLSLATTYFNNPDWQMPQIHSQSLFEATALGHPLIPAQQRVCNNIHIPTDGHIKLVTGSNMAGKSTLLRTVGLNIVLAMAGAPVCAKQLSLPLLSVHTSMRTQDALHESTSSFYAELKRLKTIIEAVDQEDNIFFLLDEILKGTNSKDRHTGSKALIEQLIRSGGAGIIATHDLELGALEATAGGAIENLCMEVAVDRGKLSFDYTIKKGVSKSFNATQLMRDMGIRIEEGL
ncbi:MAG: hypothetical protein AAFP19_21520 [Bacteroidota bacterium]